VDLEKRMFRELNSTNPKHKHFRKERTNLKKERKKGRKRGRKGKRYRNRRPLNQ